jgi:hypothetical protein
MKSIPPELIEELKKVGWFKEPQISTLAHAHLLYEYVPRQRKWDTWGHLDKRPLGGMKR